MARKNKNARKTYYDNTAQFKRLCYQLGLKPKQKLGIARFLDSKLPLKQKG